MITTRVLVCGSRNAEIHPEVVDDTITEILDEYDDTYIEFVSGGCKGGDMLGEVYAKQNDYPIVRFKPDWKTYGRAAGPIRNQEMVEYIDECENPVVIAFWDGVSKGTRNTIKLAQNKGIYVHIIRYKDYPESINAGIQLDGDHIVFDYDDDDPDDLLPLVSQKISKSRRNGHAYYYAFKANKTKMDGPQAEADWKRFLDILKHSTDTTDLKRLTDMIASKLIRTYNMFDCILYPKSASSLNECLIQSLHDIDPYIPAYPVGKTIPADVQFDWDTFKSKVDTTRPDYPTTEKKINQMMDRIHKSDRFSMQKHTIGRYRKFIHNFLDLNDFEPALNDITMSQTVLLLDDIVTSGSTINEMLHMLDSIGYEGDVVIFSLIYNK